MFYEECHRAQSYLLDVLAPCQHFDVLLSNKDKSVQFITQIICHNGCLGVVA